MKYFNIIKTVIFAFLICDIGDAAAQKTPLEDLFPSLLEIKGLLSAKNIFSEIYHLDASDGYSKKDVYKVFGGNAKYIALSSEELKITNFFSMDELSDFFSKHLQGEELLIIPDNLSEHYVYIVPENYGEDINRLWRSSPINGGRNLKKRFDKFRRKNGSIQKNSEIASAVRDYSESLINYNHLHYPYLMERVDAAIPAPMRYMYIINRGYIIRELLEQKILERGISHPDSIKSLREELSEYCTPKKCLEICKEDEEEFAKFSSNLTASISRKKYKLIDNFVEHAMNHLIDVSDFLNTGVIPKLHSSKRTDIENVNGHNSLEREKSTLSSLSLISNCEYIPLEKIDAINRNFSVMMDSAVSSFLLHFTTCCYSAVKVLGENGKIVYPLLLKSGDENSSFVGRVPPEDFREFLIKESGVFSGDKYSVITIPEGPAKDSQQITFLVDNKKLEDEVVRSCLLSRNEIRKNISIQNIIHSYAKKCLYPTVEELRAKMRDKRNRRDEKGKKIMSNLYLLMLQHRVLVLTEEIQYYKLPAESHTYIPLFRIFVILEDILNGRVNLQN